MPECHAARYSAVSCGSADHIAALGDNFIAVLRRLSRRRHSRARRHRAAAAYACRAGAAAYFNYQRHYDVAVYIISPARRRLRRQPF